MRMGDELPELVISFYGITNIYSDEDIDEF